MRVFDFDDYKTYLQARVEANKMTKGYRTALAAAADCKKSFISQVLLTHVHLTPDHAAGLSEFWRFSESEARFFLDLVLLARAGSPNLKRMIRARMKETQAKQTNLNERFKWEGISSLEIEQTYFSSWYWTAIYIATGMEGLSTASTISKRLNLPVSLVEKAIEKMVGWKLLKKKGKGWEVTEMKIHLPNSSTMTETNHSHWRQRALFNIQQQDPSALHYSLVFGVAKNDLEKLKEMVRQFLETAHKVIGPSSAEELACLTIDLFDI